MIHFPLLRTRRLTVQLRELSIAEATVKTHITAIMSKINARRRTQAVLLANSIRLFEAG